MKCITSLGRFGRETKRTHSILLLIPNKDKHVFESEKLTPEENNAAVPNKPELGNITKFHHDIENPEQIADLFIRARPIDILVTALSKNSPVLGDANIQWISKSKKLLDTNLLFTNITTSWFELFNKQIKELSDISEDTLNFSLKTVQAYLDQQPFDLEKLDDFFTALKVFEKKQFKGLDINQGVEITFDNTARYLISKDFQHTELKVVLQYLKKNSEYFTTQGYTDFVIDLINVIYKSPSNLVLKSLVFNEFYTIDCELQPNMLDKLLNLSIHSGNLHRASQVISLLVDQNTCPSVDNVNLYIYNYESQLKNSGKSLENIILELSNLKSVLFHIKMNSLLVEFFLKYAVRNTHELEHFINLIDLKKYGKEVLERLEQIEGTRMEVVQLKRRVSLAI